MGNSRETTMRRSAALARAVVFVLMTLTAVGAQEAGQGGPPPTGSSGPARERSGPDEPPPLDLGPRPQQPDVGGSLLRDSRVDDETRARLASYSTAVHQALTDFMNGNAKARRRNHSQVRFQVWVDPKGRTTRIQILSPSDDPSFDAMWRDELLPAIAFPAPPPGIPVPVVLALGRPKRYP